MKNIFSIRNLYKALAIVSFGFYVYPVSAFENPAHPRDPEDIMSEDAERHPGHQYERRILDLIDPDNAPHTEEDRKNWASRERDGLD